MWLKKKTRRKFLFIILEPPFEGTKKSKSTSKSSTTKFWDQLKDVSEDAWIFRHCNEAKHLFPNHCKKICYCIFKYLLYLNLIDLMKLVVI